MSSIPTDQTLANPIAIPIPQSLAPIFFEAKPFEEQNAEPWKKISQLAYNLFSVIAFPLGMCRVIRYGLHIFAGKLIVPAQRKKTNATIEEGRECFFSDFKAREISIKTPDGILLNGMHVPGKSSNATVASNAPTVIYFNGNGEHYEYQSLHLIGEIKSENKTDEESSQENIKFSDNVSNLSELVNRGYNVVLFNYRGVSKSQGHATRDGLILDGESIYQFVRYFLGVADENILLFGHSLGGAIAAEIAARHPGVMLCSERSFASLEKEVKVLFGKVAPWFGNLVAKLVAGLGWHFDSLSSWEKVKGRKWIAYHPEDTIIPYAASLYYNLQVQSQQIIEATQLKNQDAIESFYVQKMTEAKQSELTSTDRAFIKEILPIFSHEHNRKLLPDEVNEVMSRFN